MYTSATLSSLRIAPRRPLVAGLIGNVLDHYDTSLYGFSAVFIAPLIFPESSFIVALIMTYGLMSTSILTRPLGALFFGFFGARFGAKNSLSLSLTGLAVITCFMGLLPTYDQIGEAAPLMLALLRLAQGFFGAGESTIAPFFILQRTNQKKRGLADSIYGSTTVMGELLASCAAVFVGMSSAPEIYWRVPFLLSAFTAMAGIYLRRLIDDEHFSVKAPHFTRGLFREISTYRWNFLKVIAVSGMSYITYSIPFVFFNSFIPHITTVTYTQMMTLNTSLLAFDMVAAPFFGWLSDKVTHKKFMATMALVLALVSCPLFFMLPDATLVFVSMVRIVIVILGLGFSAPLHAWFMTQFESPYKFALVGLGYSIGSEIFGRSAPALCWALYNATHSPLGPGFYVVFVCMLAFLAVAK